MKMSSLLMVSMVVLLTVIDNDKTCSAYRSSSNGFSKSESSKVATVGAAKKSLFSPLPSLQEFDYITSDRLPWIENGYGVWKWKTVNNGKENAHDVNYLELGDPSKPALLLIHGFGASSYHFRYNIPELARDFHVYAFDKLGFGSSAKPIMEYSPEVWRDQTVDFIDQVIGKPTTVAGNSIGGLTALYTAASAKDEPWITGCVLLNAAGRFKDPNESNGNSAQTGKKTNPLVKGLLATIKRAVIALSFIVTKQPASIEKVLRQVYPVNGDMVDQELIDSIQVPSTDENAPEVFYRVITKNSGGGDDGKPTLYVDDLLAQAQCPLLLCWGEEDPWIRPAAADRIQSLYPATRTKRVNIAAGHCPHDEAPAAVNAAIREFMNANIEKATTK